ncbi:hypothetical protein AK812_SmicGene1814 [Symbiodinium microadriaticum]|uniref:Uncharacterized protein n=1 Tax=Symbiodinium microadriaticum TaxID=2951 RepID=A0A1Q9F2Z9_SYMMI|nr:hypothetical protein AK812_SmicGene1814 [Symbiodinium microadriaticum]
MSSSAIHDDKPPSPICHEALAQMVEAARSPWKRGPGEIGLSRTHSQYLYRSTLRGWSVVAAGGARRRDREKGRQGNIDANHLLDLVLEQGGLCAYSGIPMEMLRPNSHWRISVERIDTSQGYLKGNCCLIAAEFNSSVSRKADPHSGSAQWSKQKVQDVLHARTGQVHLQRLQEGTVIARLGTGRSRTKYTGFRGPDCDGKWRCGCCGIWKDNMQLFKRVSSGNGLSYTCKECSWNGKSRWRQTMRGHALSQLSNARNRAANRGTFRLEIDDILNMLWTQGGRCYYSGVPLHCAAGPADWVWSIERLDNSVTYTKQNCVLIAREFQTPDYSRNTAKNPVFGTAQWDVTFLVPSSQSCTNGRRLLCVKITAAACETRQPQKGCFAGYSLQRSVEWRSDGRPWSPGDISLKWEGRLKVFGLQRSLVIGEVSPLLEELAESETGSFFSRLGRGFTSLWSSQSQAPLKSAADVSNLAGQSIHGSSKLPHTLTLRIHIFS